MRISVIIPMYNSSKTIISALDSVNRQTAKKYILEIIVVNDGSTDDSLDKVKEYEKENKIIPIRIIDKKNEGVSSARNAGMRIANGDIIALLDSDDIWLDKKIESQINILNMHPEIDFLGGNSSDKPLRVLWKKIDKLYKANIKDISITCFPQPSTAIFKRKIISEIGYFDENQKYGEDMNYFNKICSKYNYYYQPEKLIYFGGGKRAFGHSGLSSNLKGMHYGNLKNIKELKEANDISIYFYMFLYIFYWIKYIRRIIVVNISRKRMKYGEKFSE